MIHNKEARGEIRQEIKQYLKSANQQRYCIKTVSYESPDSPSNRIYQLTIHKGAEDYPLENHLFFQINHVRDKMDQLIEKYLF